MTAHPNWGTGLMVLSEPHRWVEMSDRKRHAVRSELLFVVGDELSTFCGIQAIVDRGDVHHQGLFKECPGCDAAVRDLLGCPLPAEIQQPAPETSGEQHP